MAMEQPQAAPQSSAGGGSDSIQKLVANISNGLSMLGDVAQSAGLGDGFLQLNDQFQALVQKLASGGGSGPNAPGMGAPEAGAAQVRPAMPGSR